MGECVPTDFKNFWATILVAKTSCLHFFRKSPWVLEIALILQGCRIPQGIRVATRMEGMPFRTMAGPSDTPSPGTTRLKDQARAHRVEKAIAAMELGSRKELEPEWMQLEDDVDIMEVRVSRYRALMNPMRIDHTIQPPVQPTVQQISVGSSNNEDSSSAEDLSGTREDDVEQGQPLVGARENSI